MSSGEYQDAVDAYRRALAGDASLHAAWYGLGCASLALKAYADAADALRRAVALRPDADGARCNLAEALFQLGEVDAAIAEYQRAADSGDAEVRGGRPRRHRLHRAGRDRTRTISTSWRRGGAGSTGRRAACAA